MSMKKSDMQKLSKMERMEEKVCSRTMLSNLTNFNTIRENAIARIISEAKSASGYTIYHKTFSSAVQHALAQVEKQGYTVDGDEWDRKVALGPKKPSSGKTNIYSIDLMKNGKETPRKLQMQVYYDQGRYELNMYIS